MTICDNSYVRSSITAKASLTVVRLAEHPSHEEHQKYIREVFPRLSNEIQAGNWETVDAYIDKMIEYQCKYGGGEAADTIEPSHLIGIIVLFLIGLAVISFLIRNFAAKITKQ